MTNSNNFLQHNDSRAEEKRNDELETILDSDEEEMAQNTPHHGEQNNIHATEFQHMAFNTADKSSNATSNLQLNSASRQEATSTLPSDYIKLDIVQINKYQIIFQNVIPNKAHGSTNNASTSRHNTKTKKAIPPLPGSDEPKTILVSDSDDEKMTQPPQDHGQYNNANYSDSEALQQVTVKIEDDFSSSLEQRYLKHIGSQRFEYDSDSENENYSPLQIDVSSNNAAQNWRLNLTSINEATSPLPVEHIEKDIAQYTSIYLEQPTLIYDSDEENTTQYKRCHVEQENVNYINTKKCQHVIDNGTNDSNNSASATKHNIKRKKATSQLPEKHIKKRKKVGQGQRHSNRQCKITEYLKSNPHVNNNSNAENGLQSQDLELMTANAADDINNKKVVSNLQACVKPSKKNSKSRRNIKVITAPSQLPKKNTDVPEQPEELTQQMFCKQLELVFYAAKSIKEKSQRHSKRKRTRTKFMGISKDVNNVSEKENDSIDDISNLKKKEKSRRNKKAKKSLKT